MRWENKQQLILTNEVYIYDGSNQKIIPAGDYKKNFINVKMNHKAYNLFEKMIQQENNKNIHFEVETGYEI